MDLASGYKASHDAIEGKEQGKEVVVETMEEKSVGGGQVQLVKVGLCRGHRFTGRSTTRQERTGSSNFESNLEDLKKGQ